MLLLLHLLLVSIDLLLYEGYEALGHLEVATMLLHWWAICSLKPLAGGHRVVVIESRLHVVLLKLLRREGESGVLLLIMGGVLLKRRLLLLVPRGQADAGLARVVYGVFVRGGDSQWRGIPSLMASSLWQL